MTAAAARRTKSRESRARDTTVIFCIDGKLYRANYGSAFSSPEWRLVRAISLEADSSQDITGDLKQ
jgi:hypothetical protein